MKLKLNRPLLFLSSLFFVFTLQGCHQHEKKYVKIQPAKIETHSDGKVPLITLTPEAEKRLGIVVVQMEPHPPIHAKNAYSLPVSSILYDERGRNWVYLRQDEHTYSRLEVDLLEVDGKSALISSQPNRDAWVVSVGAAELLGTESGVGK